MPTTNPVPSQDPSDLLFNAGKLDEVLNGTGNSFTDRLGVARRTVAGMNADFDAQLADAESDLNVYRADAAASAAQALGYLNTIRTTSYGAYASDPATDPLGNPPNVGDEYFNTTSNLLKRFNGTTWQASDINTANLAAPSGSSLIGYDGQTVQDVLDGAKSLQDYAALRAYTGRATRVYITGLLATAKPAGIAGVFQHDSTDTTSIEDFGTIIVGADGRRWKRDYSGDVSFGWFEGSPFATPQKNASALVAAFSAHNNVNFPDGVYEFSFDVSSVNNSLVTFSDRNNIRITGKGATLKDVSEYSGDYLTDVFKFVRCHDIYVDVNYDAIPLVSPTAPYPNGIGYVGSSLLYFEEGCTGVKVDSRVDNARYGVRSGGYSNPAYGNCKDFDLNLRCYKTGYPAALYLASDVNVNISADYMHRAIFLAGCDDVRGSITYTGFVYATQAVLLTNSVTVLSAVDADRRARGCSVIDMTVTDNGSTGSASSRSIYGIAQQWKAPDTAFDDIKLHIFARTTDANRTLAGFRLENTVGWYATNSYSNITVSGTIDRSSQTLGASSWANISVDGINSGEVSPFSNSPSFSNINFDNFKVINGAVTGNFDVIRVPNLEDDLTFSRFHTGNTLSVIARTGRVNVEKSAVGNFVTGDIVARLNIAESTYGSIGFGITAYPMQWYDGSEFTPVLAGSTSAGVGTYTAQEGYYMRIGNRVHFHMNIGWSAHTGTGNMKITGLPFTSSNSTFCPVNIVPANIISPAGTSISAMVPKNESAINIYSIAAATSAFAPLAMDTAGSCWISGSYEAA